MCRIHVAATSVFQEFQQDSGPRGKANIFATPLDKDNKVFGLAL
jgi:hypothetical protein